MKFTKAIFALVATVTFISFTGCKQESVTSTSPNTTTANDHGHDHADGEGGHSHAAHGAGPHDGTVADWGGGKFHVEFTVDHDKQQATVYILGADQKTAVSIDAEEIELSITNPEMQVVLKADSQEGDTDGKASRFVGTHQKLGVVQEYAGTLTGVVDGTPYTGEFAEQAHVGHEH
ncbi:hypothetical protein CA13_03600 [Planctomycetes bacterium CA13]|uniref:Uncharacterized protein n=1 Tax=Novipirellula herctigrandis TaxID=2527986 RepID=A0A5C5YWP4_9BACT|nr:hypothetical protein CA13_03600 [Planctomycetes bacterium CA13]